MLVVKKGTGNFREKDNGKTPKVETIKQIEEGVITDSPRGINLLTLSNKKTIDYPY